jgi:hypothetical protein
MGGNPAYSIQIKNLADSSRFVMRTEIEECRKCSKKLIKICNTSYIYVFERTAKRNVFGHYSKVVVRE